MRDSKRRHWTLTIPIMSSHRGAGVLQPEETLPPTQPLQQDFASATDVFTDFVTDEPMVEPTARIDNTAVAGHRIGPIDSVMIRGRGASRNVEQSESSMRAVALTLLQTPTPSPWPMGHEEEGSPARQ